ncbi:pyridoxine/pyridoxamine 5'-phosphate oxidase [Streptomyces telluris]|uniref:Pyridoxal 5'-phosphate synthase n=1 Tax=Streptomyces telluris TaxID=2720021 RepID=A0A9X2LMX3_9ACTN|nr:pyridoxal 5'-phosphate synthase [Streptomyces telluris]MCQ8773891.1 pyridoxal 5'-phosphate synthase [Streptomyces telluris]NJP79206.1 pyridoxamine 5'-phosphate oxidase [Streptomyces telluris]
MENTTAPGGMREMLRQLDVFAGDLPDFDPAAAPGDPTALFVEWLRAAIDAGIPEPHAMTVSTTAADGGPSARVLLLKDVTDGGWQFAVHGASPKGRDLVERPAAALTFHWVRLARQVRLRGPVVAESPERSAADFLARSPGSRAEALMGRQSQPLESLEELNLAAKRSAERVAQDPELVAPAWVLYTLRPTTAEFWQGDRQRKHTRLAYRREEERWTKTLLWP